MSSANPIWLLIDANNHVHKDFHATGGATGKVVSLFAKRLEAMRKQFTPDRIVVAIDSPRSFRTAIEPAYKANRPAKPEDLRLAIAGVRTLCLAEEIDVVEADGFEADDCLATLTGIARKSDRRVILASQDKDLRQLLQPSAVTQLLTVSRQCNQLTCRWLTASDLFDDYGVRPEQWIDYQTLVGDSTDNVIGAQGIGDQTAAKILRKCGSLEQYYANVWAVELTTKQRASLSNFRRRSDRVRQLVTLRTDVPLPEGWMEAVA